ncbi:MAG: hypothetical protein AAF988_04015 [Pseudomonadota bacterium]
MSFLFVIGAISPVSAQLLNIREIVDIQPVNFLSDEEFEEKTQKIDQVPFGDESLAFSLRVPEGWVSNIKAPLSTLDRKPDSSLLGIVVRYVSPPKNLVRSIFSVESLELTYNVKTEDWFTSYILSQGYSLEAVTIHGPDKIEAIYVDILDNESYAVRLMATSNGTRMILARYAVPLDRFNDEKIMQAQVLNSFALKNPNRRNSEEFKTYSFLNQSFFDYPASWALVPSKIKNINRMRSSLVQGDDKDRLQGQIVLNVISRKQQTTLKDEIRLFKKNLNIPDYKTGNLIERREIPTHPDINAAAHEIYALKAPKNTKVDYELWVSVLENDDYFYIAQLVTPTRELDFSQWARNSQAYEDFLASVRRYNDEHFYE